MSESDDNEPEATELPEPEPAPAPAPKAAGNGVAWLAILVAVLALAAVGYLFYLDWRAQQAIDLSSGTVETAVSNLGRRIQATDDAVAGTAGELAALDRATRNATDEIDGLQLEVADMTAQLRLLSSLPVRISNTEAALAALQGVSDGARDTWLLGEAEYYMQLANSQLQLAGNPDLAALALGMADERVAQLANPALTNVRIAIADEIASLSGMQTADVEGITLQLASLARVVESLPLRPVERVADASSTEDGEEIGRLDRAWLAVKDATSNMVKHRTTDEQVIPLISPEAEYFLRTNLVLQMQTARLALLRGEQKVYEASLSDAARWLDVYFDADSSQVAAAIDSINEIRGGMVATEVPDISGSLSLLRRYNSVAESAQ